MRRGLQFLSGSILCGAMLATIPLVAQAVEVNDLPFALICESQNGVTFIGYLSRVNTDGTAVYGTVLGQGFAQVDESGVVQVSELSIGGGICDGSTIDELRAAGLTRDFPE